MLFGAKVTIVDEESDDEKTYRIVGQYEADMKNGSISVTSPLAKALMGKTVGDSVEAPAPGRRAVRGDYRRHIRLTAGTKYAARPGRSGFSPARPSLLPFWSIAKEDRCPP